MWLHLCLISGITPCTNTINKPLVSLVLSRRFGFVSNGGALVEVTDAKRYRDCQHFTRSGRAQPLVRVGTSFFLPADETNGGSAAALRVKVDEVLGGALRLDAAASPVAIEGALAQSMELSSSSRSSTKGCSDFSAADETRGNEPAVTR